MDSGDRHPNRDYQFSERILHSVILDSQSCGQVKPGFEAPLAMRYQSLYEAPNAPSPIKRDTRLEESSSQVEILQSPRIDSTLSYHDIILRYLFSLRVRTETI